MMDRVERLILSFQLRILENLEPDNEEMYAKDRKALEEGFEKHYEGEDAWIFEFFATGEQVLPTDKCDSVWETLKMYQFLQRSYNQLDNRDGIEERDVAFPGYDGHNEGRRLTYTRYIIEDLERYRHLNLQEGNLDSHGIMRDVYENKKEVWRDCDDPQDLTREEIQKIVSTTRNEGDFPPE